jgi:hypothetical protein
MKHWIERQGVWVETDLGVGIVLHEKDKETDTVQSWVHLVNDDGTTLAAVPMTRCADVRQARLSSIPRARIAGAKPGVLAALGYV